MQCTNCGTNDFTAEKIIRKFKQELQNNNDTSLKTQDHNLQLSDYEWSLQIINGLSVFIVVQRHSYNQWRRQGVARRGLCPGPICKPLCPGRQAIVISFCYAASVFLVTQYHFAHQQRPNFCRSWHQKAAFWKQIFKIFPRMTPPDPLCRRGYPILTKAVTSVSIMPTQKLWCASCNPARTLLAPPLVLTAFDRTQTRLTLN